jgi:DNA-directed RNA polymerase subunit beta
MEGVVVDIKVFTKKGYDKDPRALELEKEERDYLEREHYDRLIMIDKEEMLRVTKLLTREPLVSDIKIGDTEYKAGDIINGDDLKEVNRFAMNAIVKSFSEAIQNEYKNEKPFPKTKENFP